MIIERYEKNKAGNAYGTIIVKPTTSTGTLPLVVFLHGQGGKGDGSSAALNTLMGEIPTNLQLAVDKYKFIAICPQTPYSWNMDEVDSTLDWVNKNLTYDKTRRYLTGLSLGAGGAIWYVKQSLVKAKNFHAMAAIATTRQYSGSAKNIADANLPVWLFHNIDDNNGGTPVVATNEVYDDIIKYNPITKPTKTLFDKYGHGGWGEAYDPVNPPKAPNGQGLTNVNITLWDWFLMNSETKRVEVPTSTPPSTSLTAKAVATISGNIVSLNGGQSQNWKNATWSIDDVPDGVNPYSIQIKGGGWITASTNLVTQGIYVFKLTTSNGTLTATDTVEVVYGSVPIPTKQLLQKVFIPKNNNYVYVYDDGSIETKSE